MSVHANILSMPIPSIEDILAIDPLILERGMSMTEAAEFLGITQAALGMMHKRGQGPKFHKPNNLSRVYTTPRECIEWLQGDKPLAKKARQNIQRRALS
jgi:predicted transcriptional regulator